jgi:hypothetical protein
MSLAIDVDEVEEVLIAGEWYQVKDYSFTTDAYEYVWKQGLSVNESHKWQISQCKEVGHTGFEFLTNETETDGLTRTYVMSGPLSAIQAVKRRRVMCNNGVPVP